MQMKRLLSYNNKVLFLKSFILNTLVTILTVAIPYISKLFVDHILSQKVHAMIVYGVLYVGISLFIQVLYYFCDVIQGESESHVWQNICQKTAENIQLYDMVETDLSETTITQELGQTYELLKRFFNEYPVALLLYLIRALIIIGILWSISPTIAVMIGILIPIFIFISQKYSGRLSRLGSDTVNCMKDIRDYLVDSYKLMPSMRFSAHSSLIDFSPLVKKYILCKNKEVRMTSLFENFLSYAFLNFMIMMTTIISGYQTYKGWITIGDLMAIQLYISQFWTPIEYFLDVYKEYSGSKKIIENFINFLEPVQISYESTPILEIVLEKYVSLGRDGEELHEPLTTRLEKGHIYRIVGENGVGKTRLILAIVGYSMNYHGEIYLPNYRKNSNFSYCPAEPIASRFYKNELSQGASMGQLKLLQLQEAVAVEKDVYIFDEPSNFLDSQNKKKVVQILSDLLAKQKLVILISHDDDLVDFPTEVITLQSCDSE